MSNPNRRPVSPATAIAAATVAATLPETQTPQPVVDPAEKSSEAIDATTGAPTVMLLKGRVLVAFEDYEPNQLVTFGTDEARTLEDGGFIDCHPNAVAYAESLI